MYHTPLNFTPGKIKMVKTDSGCVCLLDMEITPEVCIARKETTIGLDLVVFSKLIRSLSNSGGSVMELRILKSKPDEMQIKLFHSEKRVLVTSTIVLLDITNEEIIIPTHIYSRVLSLPSADFQRYTKELSTISSKIGLYTRDGALYMEAKGDHGSSCIKLLPNPSGLHWLSNQNAVEMVGGIYPSRFLERFSKPLDINVHLFFDNGRPLVIRYKTPYSIIRLVIAPFETENEDGTGTDV